MTLQPSPTLQTLPVDCKCHSPKNYHKFHNCKFNLWHLDSYLIYLLLVLHLPKYYLLNYY